MGEKKHKNEGLDQEPGVDRRRFLKRLKRLTYVVPTVLTLTLDVEARARGPKASVPPPPPSPPRALRRRR